MYLGDFAVNATVYVWFDTFDSAGASITMTGLAVTDIEIYENGTITARASDSGYTLLDTDGIDVGGNTGIHGFSIDLSDNADAGFFASGNDYAIVVNAITIDGETVRFVKQFSIENRFMRGTDAGALASEVTAARMATLTDWIDGGRLDLLLDAIPTTAMRGTDGASTHGDPDPTGLIAGLTAARMQVLTDWIDGGRLDLLLDAIPTTAMRGTDNAATQANVATELAAIGFAEPPINVALANIPVFMVLASDGRTPATGLTLAGTRSIDGGAFGAVTGTFAEIGNGAYQFDASQADMNGTFLMFRITAATADDRFLTIRTRS